MFEAIEGYNASGDFVSRHAPPPAVCTYYSMLSRKKIRCSLLIASRFSFDDPCIAAAHPLYSTLYARGICLVLCARLVFGHKEALRAVLADVRGIAGHHPRDEPLLASAGDGVRPWPYAPVGTAKSGGDRAVSLINIRMVSGC